MMFSSCCGELGLRRFSPFSSIHRSSRLLLLPVCLRHAVRFRCILYPRLAVSSSLGTVVSAGNAIAAAAAAAGGSGAGHAGVTSALAHVAVTAVAIASGACLSTKVDFLWPRVEEQPDSLVIDGVDVTGYQIFRDAEVLKAISFARKAHYGQVRKSGEPYVAHCIHTGRILAALVPSSGKRAVNTVVAGILHDVIDDTFQNINSIENVFGSDVGHLVASVSKVSYINQLLRRHRRRSIREAYLSPDEANNLRVMLLGMVDDPRVVLIKLADRLHNMRTIHALSMPKAQAVAQETLSVWCSLASRLGVWALKAEMEDLCFAVLQPQTFRQMRAELALMWNPINRARSLRRFTSRAVSSAEDEAVHRSRSLNEDQDNIKDLLQAVLPFDLLLDRKKRTDFVDNHRKCTKSIVSKPKVASDAAIALESLTVCEEALEQELLISTSYIPGMEVKLSSRLKSLYGIYCKMGRKDVDIRQVYDARALRVVIGDRNGALHGPAVKCCYNLLDIVHRLWSPIDGEFDDYIVNPKPSGYQLTCAQLGKGWRLPWEARGRITPAAMRMFGEAVGFRRVREEKKKKKKKRYKSLHTAVHGPDNSPLEVQIRTQRMHKYAESGHAAHWLYKENNIENAGAIQDSKINVSSCQSACLEDESFIQDDIHENVDKGGRELLVAVSFGLEASEAVAERRSSFQLKRWEAYASLFTFFIWLTEERFKSFRFLISGGLHLDMETGAHAWKSTRYVEMECFIRPRFRDGGGTDDMDLKQVEPIILILRENICSKTILQEDQFKRLLPTFIQVIDLTETEESEYWNVVSAVFEGKQVDPIFPSKYNERSSLESPNPAIVDDGINNKVNLLRTMLQWEDKVRHGATLGKNSRGSAGSHGRYSSPAPMVLGEVVIIRWPHGEIMRLRSGSTAADAARRLGAEGKLVLVNGQLVLPNTELKDGDLLEVKV
ncbi:hypothetical protein AXF42_Ash015337 [Apostasia shenzhenica]|uniref:Uncharacterized protein n=1 Tax=Apostasia shenzhenica TaxID=1088818 RepID=A0A2I0ALZ9_9ASPA|nr:hypothetical protein AXF42_Ash015337 [Apostasia shenzhenica]